VEHTRLEQQLHARNVLQAHHLVEQVEHIQVYVQRVEMVNTLLRMVQVHVQIVELECITTEQMEHHQVYADNVTMDRIQLLQLLVHALHAHQGITKVKKVKQVA
jgi:hypothetical protein